MADGLLIPGYCCTVHTEWLLRQAVQAQLAEQQLHDRRNQCPPQHDLSATHGCIIRTGYWTGNMAA